MKKEICEGCTLCCKLFLVNLTEKEFYSGVFLTELNGSEQSEDFDIIEKYGLNIVKKNGDGTCIYLKDGKCEIYSARPEVCRDFFCGSEKIEFKVMIENINNTRKERKQ